MADKTLLPAGMVDVLPPHADFEARTVESLMATFASYGYERVKPPLMEFEDSFLSGAGAALASQAFRLMDPISQRMLVLRPDMTMQVARIAVDRLAAAPRPLRLGYAGQVAYVSATQLRPGRQVGQVGVELIGPCAPQADAEVILMIASALAGSGARGLTVDLAIPTLVPALVADAGLDVESHHRLRVALDRKDIAGVAEMAGRLGLELTGTLTEMVALAGPCDAVMQGLMALPLPPAAEAERAALARVVACIQAHGFGPDLSIDPVENRGFEYHTGVTFAVAGSFLVLVAWIGGRQALDGPNTLGGVVAAARLPPFPLRPLRRPAPTGEVLPPARTGAERPPARARDEASARGLLHEAAPQEVRLVHLLDRVLALADRGGDLDDPVLLQAALNGVQPQADAPRELGVEIMTIHRAKGLEFDTLFVPELQQVTMDSTSAATRMTFYVVMSRARDELHLSWSGTSGDPDIVKDLKGLVERK